LKNSTFNNIFYISIFVICFNCCTSKPAKPTHQQLEIKYKQVKNEIAIAKKKIIEQYSEMANKKQEWLASEYIQLFLTKMYPAWKGTPWKFTGTTTVPLSGTIACGYFVTTTIQDMLFPIERIKYAQCASQQTLEHLVQPQYVKIYNGLSFNQFINQLQNHKDFLGLVGLDTHIGYLIKTNNQIHFIHSSIATNGVADEVAKNSNVLRNSKWKSVAFLTDDEQFLKKWIVN
jgi:hypothetical protein